MKLKESEIIAVILVLILAHIGLSWTPHRLGQRFHQRTLRALSTELDEFRQKWGSMPISLFELNAFAHSQGRQCPCFDITGRSFRYDRLDDQHYFVTAYEKDPIHKHRRVEVHLSNWQSPEAPHPQLRLSSQSVNLWYPFLAMAGLKNPQGNWTATLLRDESLGKSRLVVTSLGNASQHTFTSSEDQIEEFLWLAPGDHIVYIAKDRDFGETHLYLWNLRANVTNRIDFEEKIFGRNTLATGTMTGSRQLQENYGYTLIASHPKGLKFDLAAYQLQLAQDKKIVLKRKLVSIEMDRQQKLGARVEIKESPNSTINVDTRAWFKTEAKSLDESIKSVFALPSWKGDLQSELERWQGVVEESTEQSYRFHLITALAFLYAQSADQQNPVQAKSLHTFALELFAHLEQHPEVPNYIKLIAIFKQIELSSPGPRTFEMRWFTKNEEPL